MPRMSTSPRTLERSLGSAAKALGRHEELRQRLGDRGAAGSPQMVEDWGGRQLAYAALSELDTEEMSLLAPSQRSTTLKMTGSMGSAGAAGAGAPLPLVVRVRGTRPSTRESRNFELGMEKINSEGHHQLTPSARKKKLADQRTMRRLKSTVYFQEKACHSRRSRIAPRGGVPQRRSSDATAKKCSHEGLSQLSRELQSYKKVRYSALYILLFAVYTLFYTAVILFWC